MRQRKKKQTKVGRNSNPCNSILLPYVLENNSNEENERKAPDITDIKPSHICSPALTRPILTSSRLGSSNPFTSQTGASNSILRPPQLAANSNGRSSFSLNPSRLNPFSKVSASEPSEATTNNVARTNGETPKFVPLLQSEKSNAPVVKPAATPVPPIQTSNFVFGQNLQERVIADNKTEEPKPSTSLNSNGTVDMLFTSAASKAEVASVQGKETKTLSESAREYEESRAVKRKFEEVEIITGEEGETNVLQVGCKLFSFDKASGSWQERGQGNLRLNDFEVRDDGESYTQSRLVFRTVGGLRVILNTKVSGICCIGRV